MERRLLACARVPGILDSPPYDVDIESLVPGSGLSSCLASSSLTDVAALNFALRARSACSELCVYTAEAGSRDDCDRLLADLTL